MGSNFFQVIPQHKGRKILLHCLLFMIRKQVVIFSAVSKLYLREWLSDFLGDYSLSLQS